MHIGLVIGKKNSMGVPGKNTKIILGRPAAEYSFIAAKYSKIEKVYLSTDSEEIIAIGEKYNASIIHRPEYLALPSSLTEDVLTHAYNIIKQDCPLITTISLFLCNNPCIDVNLLNTAIDLLLASPDTDACVSIAKYDMFTPVRAKKLDENNYITPIVDLAQFDNISSIRDSQGSVYFCDFSVQVMKPVCFEKMEEGYLPIKWHGKKTISVKTDFGFDIDAEWQVAVVEFWLKKHGYTETIIPWI